MVDRLSWIDASNQLMSFVLKRTDLTMKLIEWNYLSIFEFNLCTGIIHVLYCYFLISHTFIYDVLLFLATTFAFFLLSSSLHTLQIFTLLNKCTYIYVIFCYFCNITFFPFLILEKFCCFLEEKMHMVSQGFIFNVSQNNHFYIHKWQKKIMFIYYRNWLSHTCTYSSHNDKKFKWIYKYLMMSWTTYVVLKRKNKFVC